MIRAMNVKIETENLVITNLKITDVTQNYLSWLRNSNTSKYISSARSIDSIEKLKSYVDEKISDPKIVFLGIFDKKTKKHIGNIKYDLVESEDFFAIMGILIGEDEYRGRGIAKESIVSTALWLFENAKVHFILLGVNKRNIAAVNAYKKIGFQVSESEHLYVNPDTSLCMRLNKSSIVP